MKTEFSKCRNLCSSVLYSHIAYVKCNSGCHKCLFSLWINAKFFFLINHFIYKKLDNIQKYPSQIPRAQSHVIKCLVFLTKCKNPTSHPLARISLSPLPPSLFFSCLVFKSLHLYMSSALSLQCTNRPEKHCLSCQAALCTCWPHTNLTTVNMQQLQNILRLLFTWKPERFLTHTHTGVQMHSRTQTYSTDNWIINLNVFLHHKKCV